MVFTCTFAYCLWFYIECTTFRYTIYTLYNISLFIYIYHVMGKPCMPYVNNKAQNSLLHPIMVSQFMLEHTVFRTCENIWSKRPCLIRQPIVLDKMLVVGFFLQKKTPKKQQLLWLFFLVHITYVVGIHWKYLDKMFPVSTFFPRKKILLLLLFSQSI